MDETERWVSQASSLAIDIETTGLSPWKGDRILGISLSDGLNAEYLPLGHTEGNVSASYVEDVVLERVGDCPQIRMHNALFDLSFLCPEWMDYPEGRLWDTMVAAWLEDENRPLGLKTITGEDDEQQALKRVMAAHCRDCGHNKSKTRQKIKVCKECGGEWQERRPWADLSPAEIAEYAAKDAYLTWHLGEDQQQRLEGDDLMAFEREMAVLQIVHEMTQDGVRVDEDAAQAGLDKCLALASGLERDIPINLKSPKQLGEWLQAQGVRLTGLTPTGGTATNYDALLPFQKHPAVAKVLKHRDATKTGQLYEALRKNAGEDSLIHPRWRPTGTVSGRFSCTDPNLMQMPRKGGVRECLVPETGRTLLTTDLSQAELRVAASYSKCRRLIELFNAGEDVYATVAGELGVERQTAKIVVLSSLYGVGARKLRLILLRGGIDVPEKEARRFLTDYRVMFPELRQLMARAERVAWDRGYVRLIAPGRYRHFPPGHWRANPKDAMNALVQGGVAEAVKELMLQTRKEGQRLDVRPVLQVHDSLTWSCPEGVEQEWRAYVEATWEEVNPFEVRIPMEWKHGV